MGAGGTWGVNASAGLYRQVGQCPGKWTNVQAALRRLARVLAGRLGPAPVVLLGHGGEDQAVLISEGARIRRMLTGKRIRLKIETLAIETDSDGKRIAVTVPGGEVVRVLSGPRPDDRRMVDVLWDKRALVMFAEDLERRGELIEAATK